MGTGFPGTSSVGRALQGEVVEDSKLKACQQCALAARKVVVSSWAALTGGQVADQKE